MSSELHKHIEERLIKNKSLFNAKVLNFPKDKNLNISTKLKIDDNFWNINDKSNEDQLRAVIGVCFMFGALILMGLYANFM
tara:strand:- start:287 stop:529 length:243 start_codon:yes stop_codon:yes gene_type:complete